MMSTLEGRDRAPEAAHHRLPSRSLLVFGILAGPWYLAVGLAQALVREGFDFSRHALSHLANGPGGWVQTANFAATGLMVLAAAVGMGRALAPQGRATTWFLGGFGVCLLLAAVFPADPVFGFPPGAPEGDPTSISTPGLVHFVVGALGFVCLGISCLAAVRPFAHRSGRGRAGMSALAGVIVFVGFFGGPFFGPAGLLGIWISVVVGWGWLAVVSYDLRRT